ncbi:unnamed protein product [Dicrocoelium dendriticum]|nr:unnamed protein product [Dicrocoelium dendriticum]
MHTLWWILLLLPFFVTGGFSGCKSLGESCWKTVFDPCCGSTVCDLDVGKCIKCYALGHGCLRDSECCDDNCHLFMCAPPGYSIWKELVGAWNGKK